MVWWLVAGILVAAELATGTFYLLMVAVGCVAGALAAHAGMSGTGQVVTAALLGAACTAGWHFKRARSPRSAPAERNSDVNIDIGQTLHVEAWAADGTARVPYRGAAWSVQFEGPGTPAPGMHVIVAVQGSQLRVAPAAPR
ncbi:MAG: NfeD family protein [Burkholderiaceae bacterium]|nr:NfeD family protein [Burkholderiaceae bacterium]